MRDYKTGLWNETGLWIADMEWDEAKTEKALKHLGSMEQENSQKEDNKGDMIDGLRFSQG